MSSNSLSLICPIAHNGAANLLFQAKGWGEGNFSLSFSATGSAPVTHTGLHMYEDSVAEFVVARIVPPELEDDLIALGSTLEAAQDAIEAISVYSVPNTQAITNITTLADSLGLIRFTPEEG